jgi:hypothetical protein
MAFLLYKCSWTAVLQLLCPTWVPPGLYLEPLGRLLGLTWTFLGALGHLLDPTWSLLGASWSQLGRTWGQLGRTWGQLGRTWGQLGRTWGQLGRTWGQLGRTRGQLGRTWGQLGRTWGQLGRTWGQLGRTGGQLGRHLDFICPFKLLSKRNLDSIWPLQTVLQAPIGLHLPSSSGSEMKPASCPCPRLKRIRVEE